MSLSQKEYGELRGLYESVYTPKVEITEELIDDIVDELVEELVEEGYSEEEAYSLVEEATDTYIDEAKVTFGHDTQATRKSGAPVGARRRYGMRKAGQAVKAAKGAVDTAKKKAAGVAAGAAIAGSIAKDEARRAGRKAVHSASKAADAVKSAPDKARAAASDAKKKAKSGIKGFIKRQAQKVVNRMSEEIEVLEASGLFTEQELGAIMEAEVQELYKGKHGQSEKEYQDGRSDAGKMISGDSKHSGAAYSHRSYKGVGKPAKPGERQKNQGKMDRGTRADLAYRKANLKKEEVEVEEGYKEIDAKKHGRMYDRYKKLRSAAIKDAQDSGEASGTNRMKMGKMSAVIDKSSENLRKKQTKDQLTGRG